MPDARTYSTMSNCGDRYIIFDSYTGTKSELWRTDADGSNPTRLVQQDINDEDCSPDGKWLVYATNSLSEGSKIYRMPIEGGTPTEIGSAPGGGGWAHISPDGKFVAYDMQEGNPVPQLKYGIIPAGGGSPVLTLSRPSGSGPPHWAPDGKGLDFLLTRKGASNVWEQRLAGGEPRQITDFPSGHIFGFSWSRDGKELYVAKGIRTSDVILISNFR